MSDVGISIGLAWLVLFAFVAAWPGILFGGVSGALLWRARRILGALLGGILGWAVGIGIFVIWRESSLSRNLDYWDAMTSLGLLGFLPGWCTGAAIGGRLWRDQPLAGIAAGGVIGALAGVAGWTCYTLAE